MANPHRQQDDAAPNTPDETSPWAGPLPLVLVMTVLAGIVVIAVAILIIRTAA